MTQRRKATIRGRWWRSYLGAIRHCYKCGHLLKKRFVPAEKAERLVCTYCSAITYLNPRVVVGLIPRTQDGRVVLLKRANEPAKGYWTFPAGFQEMGESAEDAALRETKEEICVRPKLEGFVGVYAYRDAGVATLVYAGVISAKQTPRVGDEAEAVGVFSPRSIPWKKLAFRSVNEALKAWLKNFSKRTSLT